MLGQAQIVLQQTKNLNMMGSWKSRI
jgi:hypothetical protein